MATVKGVNRTVADQTSNLHTLAPGLFGGNVKVMVDTYELSSLASGSIIEMGGDLPIGARVLAVHLVFDGLGGSVTMDVGDAEDANRYISAEAVSSAGEKWGALADGVEYEIDETDTSNTDRQVLITTGGATGTGTVKLKVYYTHE